MGFSLKLVLVNPVVEPAFHGDGEGIPDSGSVTVWRDIAGYSIDFGNITRLEKVVSPRYKHLEHTSYKRAGICVTDCFFDLLFVEDVQTLFGQVAPEILFPAWALSGNKELTQGATYLDASSSSCGDDESYLSKISRHNSIVTEGRHCILNTIGKEHVVLSDVVRWEDCAYLVHVLDKAEKFRTEAWKALEVDEISLAIAKSWREVLRAFTKTHARAVFLFGW